MAPANTRPGYDQIRAASFLPPNAEAWKPFVRDVLGLPLSMLPGVQYAVNTKVWKNAKAPLEQVRNAATNWAERSAVKDAEEAISLNQITSRKTNPLQLIRSLLPMLMTEDPISGYNGTPRAV